jgi:hypothetical protein
MDKHYNVIKTILQNRYSLTRYSVRIMKDSYLHDDVEAFLAKHDTSLNNLVNMLINDHFSLARQTDPSYPA